MTSPKHQTSMYRHHRISAAQIGHILAADIEGATAQQAMVNAMEFVNTRLANRHRLQRPGRGGRGMTEPRRYSIEIRDLATGAKVLFTAADWTDEEWGFAIARIMRLVGLPDTSYLTGTPARPLRSS